MGYTTSTVHGIEVPDSSEANDVPEDIGKVVTALEAGSLVKRLTGAQISALTSPQKPAGLLVYNTTTGKLQISNGTTFADVGAPVYAIGVRDSNFTLTNNSWWTVSYTSETDPSSILSSGVVTLPSAGLWLVTGSVTLSLIETDDMKMMLEQNNAAISGIPYGTYVKMGASTQQTLQHTALVYASASDTIRMRVWAYNTGGGSRECVGARLSVAKIGA